MNKMTSCLFSEFTAIFTQLWFFFKSLRYFFNRPEKLTVKCDTTEHGKCQPTYLSNCNLWRSTKIFTLAQFFSQAVDWHARVSVGGKSKRITLEGHAVQSIASLNRSVRLQYVSINKIL